MRMAIVGYGKMGHEIESIANSRKISYTRIDPHAEGADYRSIDESSLRDVDVAVDFTHPSAALDNLKLYAALEKNVVMGTTGWYEKMDDARKLVEQSNIGFIWAANFSLGVNIFFRVVKEAAGFVDKIDDYDVFVHEFHHREKADSPSGTAVLLGKILVDSIKRKDRVVYDKLSRRIEADEIHVSSSRGGFIPGTHLVGFDSQADTIELRHTARGRRGFASGAVLAAEFILGRRGFYTIDDMFESLFREG